VLEGVVDSFLQEVTNNKAPAANKETVRLAFIAGKLKEGEYVLDKLLIQIYQSTSNNQAFANIFGLSGTGIKQMITLPLIPKANIP
jgi:hypothetical protein